MKRFVLTSAEPVLLTLPEESFYSVPGAKVVLQKKKRVVTVGYMMFGIKTG